MQRMGGRVVEGTGLENRQARKRLEGSNPSPSANIPPLWSERLNATSSTFVVG
jgi:hypothetical protein